MKSTRKEFETILDNINLEELLQKLAQHDLTSDDYSNIKFELDFSDCYYEGDWPRIVAKEK